MNEKLQSKLEADKALMDALKVTQLSHVLCKTNQGDLTLTLNKGEYKYSVMLDNVPLEEDKMTFVLPGIQHLI